MSTLDAADFFALNPEAMAAFNQLANRHGQNLEASPVIPDDSPLRGAVLIRNTQSRKPVAVVWPDGRAVDMERPKRAK